MDVKSGFLGLCGASYDSGIEWLGIVPAGWRIKKLKFLSKIKTGEKDTVNKVDSGRYPFFIRSPRVERIETYSHDEEAVLTAGDGDIGKIFHYINGKFEYHQRVYKFSKFKEISGKYLYYYLHRHLGEEVIKLSAKSTVDSLRLPMLQNFPVLLPSLEEQVLISDYLDKKTTEIDEAIANKQHLIELLKEQKAILINQAVTKGLTSNVPMRDSGVEWIGNVPKHWNGKKAKFLFTQSHLPVRKIDGVVTAYRDGQVTLRSIRRAEGYTVAILEQGYQGIRKGQLVLNSMDAFAGAIGVSDSDGKCSPEYVICDPIEREEVVPMYYALLLREMALSGYIEVISSAVRQRAMRIRFNNLASLLLPVPPLIEQTAIVEKVADLTDRFDAVMKILEREIEAILEYKAILIANTVTGKIKI